MVEFMYPSTNLTFTNQRIVRRMGFLFRLPKKLGTSFVERNGVWMKLQMAIPLEGFST